MSEMPIPMHTYAEFRNIIDITNLTSIIRHSRVVIISVTKFIAFVEFTSQFVLHVNELYIIDSWMS